MSCGQLRGRETWCGRHEAAAQEKKVAYRVKGELWLSALTASASTASSIDEVLAFVCHYCGVPVNVTKTMDAVDPQQA